MKTKSKTLPYPCLPLSFFKTTYLDLRNRHLLGQEMNLMTISKLNQALQTHSTKKNASCALVWALSRVLKIKNKTFNLYLYLLKGNHSI